MGVLRTLLPGGHPTRITRVKCWWGSGEGVGVLLAMQTFAPNVQGEALFPQSFLCCKSCSLCQNERPLQSSAPASQSDGRNGGNGDNDETTPHEQHIRTLPSFGHKCTDRHSHVHTYTHSHSYTHTHTLTPIHSHTLMHTHTLTHTHAISFSRSHTHTRGHTCTCTASGVLFGAHLAINHCRNLYMRSWSSMCLHHAVGSFFEPRAANADHSAPHVSAAAAISARSTAGLRHINESSECAHVSMNGRGSLRCERTLMGCTNPVMGRGEEEERLGGAFHQCPRAN